MSLCPYCQSENRAGAKFCKNCAKPLPITSKATLPLDYDPTLSASSRASQSNLQTMKAGNSSSRTDTKPLAAGQSFNRRPPGAIFGESFLFQSLVFSDDNQIRYLVSQLPLPEIQQIRTCRNPQCGALFPPRQTVPDKFCTDCGSPVDPGVKDLLLIETLTAIAPNVIQVVSKGLSHGSVRAPLAAFQENLAGVPRYSLVVPQVSALENRPDAQQALRWGEQLARGLDYLHDNGLSFNGRIDNTHIGVVGDRAVWANFSSIVVHPDHFVSDRKADTRALAMQIFNWMTGRTQYEHDPNLLPNIRQVFEQALNSQGFASGLELADALSRPVDDAAMPKPVEHHLGRRTNVGMVRTLNEDSLLTVEINRIQQSVSQPLSLYVVADGMGGHAAGEIASGAIVNAMAQKALTELMLTQLNQGTGQDRLEWLRTAVEAANKVVFDLRKTAGTDMGSTLVSAVVEGNRAYVAHVGDSRAYQINAQGVRQITVDHSLVERLIATNQITREEARHHPQRNVIYRTIGDKAKIDVEVSAHTLEIGDYLLLCSDGMSGMVEDSAMQQIVLRAASPQNACDELIKAANAAGGDDNITVILVQIIPA